ncbi:MAG: immunoglobulin-like domain-containing protein, partial [Acholeplasmataceae bacterium]
MKKIGLILSILVFMLVVVACKPSEETVVDQDPVISGAVDKTINRGDTFVPLQGITATDEEDGDLTDDIVYTGNVNPNVAGSYEATYSVTDSAGNLVSVTITITVVIVDEEDPLISGAGDVTIMLGDTFDVTAGVTANDTIDGDLTEDIVITGEVNVWVPGVYDVTYTVEDEAGNEATRVRKVTVSLGYFVFGEDDVLVNGSFDTDATGWLIVGATESIASGVLTLAITEAATLTQDEISGGVMNTSVADFTLAKLVINAKAGVAQTIIPS